MFSWFANLMRALAPAEPAGRTVRVIRAKYDAAALTEDNRRHWANADGLSANAANSPAVRRVLRNRARYETANNSYARGIVLTLAKASAPNVKLLETTTKAAVLAELRLRRPAGLHS